MGRILYMRKGSVHTHEPADVTPVMTSNTTPSGFVVSASSVHGTYGCWYAFDGVDSTASIGNRIWHSGAGIPQWIMLKFPAQIKVVRFSVKNRADIDTGKPYGPTAFELQGSNDGVEFDTLGTYTASGALGKENLFWVQTPGEYQYYRLYITDTGYTAGSSKYAVVDQIRFYVWEVA